MSLKDLCVECYKRQAVKSKANNESDSTAPGGIE